MDENFLQQSLKSTQQSLHNVTEKPFDARTLSPRKTQLCVRILWEFRVKQERLQEFE